MIPVLTTQNVSIASTWENSLINLYRYGIEIPTQYDKEGDPQSRDCTMMMVVEKPLSEPMIHKDMPGGLSDLQEYVMEVCDGIKDHWITDDEQSTKWRYGYHKRLFNYNGFDQIEHICKLLKETSYTRRAQAIVWDVSKDSSNEHCPCLQRLHFRLINNHLCMNINIRSNDAYLAAFMNMFAFVMLQKQIADRLNVKVGHYVHFADSYHIYGKNLKDFEDRFLYNLKKRSFEQRTMNYSDVKDMMDEYIPSIKQKVHNLDTRE